MSTAIIFFTFCFSLIFSGCASVKHRGGIMRNNMTIMCDDIEKIRLMDSLDIESNYGPPILKIKQSNGDTVWLYFYYQNERMIISNKNIVQDSLFMEIIFDVNYSIKNVKLHRKCNNQIKQILKNTSITKQESHNKVALKKTNAEIV